MQGVGAGGHAVGGEAVFDLEIAQVGQFAEKTCGFGVSYGRAHGHYRYQRSVPGSVFAEAEKDVVVAEYQEAHCCGVATFWAGVLYGHVEVIHGHVSSGHYPKGYQIHHRRHVDEEVAVGVDELRIVVAGEIVPVFHSAEHQGYEQKNRCLIARFAVKQRSHDAVAGIEAVFAAAGVAVGVGMAGEEHPAG